MTGTVLHVVAAANASHAPRATTSPAAANQPRHDLDVHIIPQPEALRASGTPIFWRLLGDLAAEVLLDGVEGPWGTTENPNSEILAA